VNSTIYWEVTSKPDWVTVVTQSGTPGVNMTFTFEYTENTNAFERRGVIALEGNGDTAELIVTQELPIGTTPMLDVDPSTRLVGFAAATTGGITVTSNVFWSVNTATLPSWITSVTPISSAPNTAGTAFAFTCLENNGFAERRGLITFTGSYGLTKTLEVTQQISGTPFIEFKPSDKVTVGQGGGARNVSVDANVYWTMTSKPDWVSSVTESGEPGEGTAFSFTVAPNSSDIERRGLITLTGSDGTTTGSLEVTQYSTDSDKPTSLVVVPTEITVTAPAGISSAAMVQAKVYWTMTSKPAWVTNVTPSGNPGNTTLSIQYELNAGSERIGEIVFEGGLGLSATLKVTQQGEVTSSITATPKSVTVPAVAGTNTEVSIDANVAWTMASKPAWVTSVTASGTLGITPISIAYEANTGTAERRGEIVFSGGGVTETVTITQQLPITETAAITVAPTTLTAAAAGETQSATVTSNVYWTSSSDASWLTVTTSGAPGSETITVTSTPNTGTTERQGTITFSGSGASATLVVTQRASTSGNTDSLTVDPTTISIESPDAGTNTDATVSSNVYWTMMSKPDWVTSVTASGSPGDTNISIVYTANDGTVARSGDIVFSGGEGLTATIAISQAGTGSASIVATPNAIYVLETADTNTEVSVEANVAWTMTSKPDWVTSVTASGAVGTTTITIAYEANPSTTQERQGTITFSGGGTSDTVTITQAYAGSGDIDSLVVDPNAIYVLATAGTDSASVTVTSSVYWAASSEATWLTFAASGAPGSGNFAVTYEANTDGAERRGTITFMGGDGLVQTLEVTQAYSGSGEDDSLVVDPDTIYVAGAAGMDDTTVVIDSSVYWTASSEATWITFDESGEPGIDNFAIAYEANTGATERMAVITIEGGDGLVQTLTVIQGFSGSGDIDSLTVDPMEITVTAPAGTNTAATVTSKVYWTATSWPAWVTSVTASGSPGDTTITIVYTENTSDDPRDGVIVFEGGIDLTATLAITQSGIEPPFIIADPKAVYVAGEMNTNTEVTISANVSWTVTSKPDWVWLVSPESGAPGEREFSFLSIANTDTVERRGTIVFSGGGVTETLTVTQKVLPYIPTHLSVTPTEMDVPGLLGMNAATIVSNVFWTAESSDPSWLTVVESGAPNGLAFFNYAANNSGAERRAVITFTSHDGLEATLTVTQRLPIGTPAVLMVDPMVRHVGPDAATENDIALEANIFWTAVSNVPWLTVTGSGEPGTESLTISYETNNTEAERTGVITFSGNGASTTLTVIQGSPVAPFIAVDTTEIHVPATAGENTEVTLSANVAWSIVSWPSWVTYATPNGVAGNTPLTIHYAANTDTVERQGTIVYATAGGLTATITITQAILGYITPELSVIPTAVDVPALSGTNSAMVVTNLYWTASSDSEWLTVTESGAPNGLALFTYAQNTAPAERRGVITFTSRDGLHTATLTVTQRLPIGISAMLEVDPTEITVPAEAGMDDDIEVTSNVYWTASSDSEWLTVTESGAPGVETITVSFEANTTRAERTGVITFRGNDGAIATLTVTQERDVQDWYIINDEDGNPDEVELNNGDTAGPFDNTFIGDGPGDNDNTLTLNPGSELDSEKIWVGTVDEDGNPVNEGNKLIVNDPRALDNVEDIYVAPGNEIVIPGDDRDLGDILDDLPNIWVWDEDKNEWVLVDRDNKDDYVYVDDDGNVIISGGGQTLEIYPHTYETSNAADTFYTYIASNTSWTFSSDVDWLTFGFIDPADQKGNGGIVVNIAANTVAEPRTGVVTIKAGPRTKTVTVTQRAGDYINVMPEEYTAPAAAIDFTVEVKANVAWTATVETAASTWLSVSDASGTNDGSFTVHCAANTNGQRVGTITVTNGTIVKTVEVVQHSQQFEIDSDEAVTVPHPEDSFEVEVTANTVWSASSNATSWLTVSPTSGLGSATATVSFTENDTDATRTGVITFISHGGVVTKTVTVTQLPEPRLEVDPENYVALATGGSFTAEVTSNGAWTAVSNDPWLEVSPASGTGNDTLVVDYGNNYLGTPREGTITLTYTGTTFTRTIRVVQGTPALNASPLAHRVPGTQGTVNVTVDSNVAWTVVSYADWLTVSPATGSGNGTLVITHAINPGAERTGLVSIVGAGLINIIVVTQDPLVPTGAAIITSMTATTEAPYKATITATSSNTAGNFAVFASPSSTFDTEVPVAWGAIAANGSISSTFDVALLSQLYYRVKTSGAEFDGAGVSTQSVATSPNYARLSMGDWMIGKDTSDNEEVIATGSYATVFANSALWLGYAADADDNSLVIDAEKLRASAVYIGINGGMDNVLQLNGSLNPSLVGAIYLAPDNALVFERYWTSKAQLLAFLGDTALYITDDGVTYFQVTTADDIADYLDISTTGTNGMRVTYTLAEPPVTDIERATIDEVTVNGGQVTVKGSSANAGGFYVIYTADRLADTSVPPASNPVVWTHVPYTATYTGVLNADGSFTAIFPASGTVEFYRVLTSATEFVAGVSSSVEAYSFNVGGHYSVTLPAGITQWVANQFDQPVGKNTINELFSVLPNNSRLALEGLPPITRVPVTNWGASGGLVIERGTEVRITSAAARTLVFSGTLSNDDPLTKEVLAGISTLTSSALPIVGAPEDLGVTPRVNNTQVIRMTLDGEAPPKSVLLGNWQGGAPIIAVGESFKLRYPTKKEWTQELVIPENKFELSILKY